jgi:hypothetical protein
MPTYDNNKPRDAAAWLRICMKTADQNAIAVSGKPKVAIMAMDWERLKSAINDMIKVHGVTDFSEPTP